MRLTCQTLGKAAATLHIGQELVGKVGTYKVISQIQEVQDVWTAMYALMHTHQHHVSTLVSFE